MAILIFFLAHWYLSAFCQTFFLHRYSAHQMFKMNKFWEKFFYILTFITQGSSYLNPRAYALMHRMHHAYSDQSEDPHSPAHYKTVMGMMKNTLFMYLDIKANRIKPDEKFEGGYPRWNGFDEFADHRAVRVTWALSYVGYYIIFATAWWMYLLLPLHFLMGPLHGAIVNWCGHKYGYQNFDNKDQSCNTLPVDLITMGELMQNNHHRSNRKLNFAMKWFEIDPAYPMIQLLRILRIVRASS